MKHLITASLLTSVVLFGCSDGTTTEIDQQLLTEYRRAIPSIADLEAPMVEGSTRALGDPAIIPASSYPIVIGINSTVAVLIGLLEEIVKLPPTVYNSETLEFFWGPFPNGDGVGYVAVYIRDAGENDDFRYHFAFLRGIDNDVAKLTPVIWGGANPDENNEDHGVGVALFDFEANYQFEQTHNPDAADLQLERGRFATLFGAGPDEDNTANEMAFVVAAFRAFVPGNEPTAQPADLDYLYGHYANNAEGHTLDFVDWQSQFDVDDPADNVVEDVGVRMAFFDAGVGRAEADVANGSFGNDTAQLTECWDTSINQTYLKLEATGGPVLVEVGLEEDCGIFKDGLSTLGVPSLEDIDDELLTALSSLAANGIPAE
ncbi:MAG: hypothetical protein MJE77_09210 [Proteobacteria bacterium]|nr:hypothetical protein [Pseudomonadota bacterium]